MLLRFLLLILYSSNLLKWYEVSPGSELVVKVGEGEEQGQDSQPADIFISSSHYQKKVQRLENGHLPKFVNAAP